VVVVTAIYAGAATTGSSFGVTMTVGWALT